MSKRHLIALMVFGVAMLMPGSAEAAAIVGGFNSTTLPRNDDGSAGPVALGFEVDLFGLRRNSVFVNNNGNVTFDTTQSTYTPFNLLSTNTLIVAPFFADVDTSAAGQPVTYGTGTFEGRPAFGVNWIDVDYFSSSTTHTRRNSFQLILVGRADRGSGDFDIVFNYDRIQWEAGSASGGDANGLGGFSARAGYAIGRGVPGSSFELAGSAQPGSFIDGGSRALASSSRGTSVAGRHVFEIRSTQATQVSALTPFGNAPSTAAASDASGNYVVFASRASNLAGSDPNPGTDIFRIDTRSGDIEPVSVDNEGGAISGDASEPAVSGDGQLVFFVAADAGVGKLLGEDASAREKRRKTAGQAVFLRNMLTGTTQRMGPAASGASGTKPQPSSEGDHLVFTGTTTSASEGQVGQDNVYLVPLIRNGNAVTPGTLRCVSCKSVTATGAESSQSSNGQAKNPVVSKDGSMVAWETTATNALQGVAPPCPGATSSVLVRNMVTGQMTQPSSPSGGSCGSGGSRAPQLDDDGDTLVFESDQPLAGGDSNAAVDVYAVDLGLGSLQRVSVAANGTQGNGASGTPAISGDGRVVAFVSTASNLDPASADTNGVADVHVKVLGSGSAARLSLTDTGAQANGASARPDLNFDGSRVVFDSVAGNLAPGAVTGISVVFQRANPLVTAALKSATWWNPAESGWGLFIFEQAGVIAPAWFTYDTDGEPVWFLAAGLQPQSDGSYLGPVFRFTGVPLAQISGRADETATEVGSVSLRFSGDNALQFQYTYNGTTQTKQLERFPFGDRQIICRDSPTVSRASATNYSDIWWGGAATNGWGLFFNHVDDTLVAIWYTYDTDREPLFLVIVASRQSNGSFTGQIFRQRNGTPLLQINGQPPSPASDVIGTATFTFTNGELGNFAYTIGATNQSKPIERLQFGSVPSVCEAVPAAAR